MEKKLGLKLLEAMSRQEALNLLSDKTQIEIAIEYKVSIQEVSTVLSNIISLRKTGESSRFEKIEDTLFGRNPFSKNEDDYGYNQHQQNQIITNKGVFDFSGNEPIKKDKSMLTLVVEWYKYELNQVKLNNGKNRTVRG